MGDLPLKAVRTHRAQLEETLKSVPTGELERAARILADFLGFITKERERRGER